MEIDELDAFFQSLTAAILGVDANSQVRVSYPDDGAPAWGFEEDVIFVHPRPVDGSYNRQREHAYLYSASPEEFDDTVSYTRIDEVNWVLYGPNSFKYAMLLRDAMFYDDNRIKLAKNNLHLIPDIVEPIHTHELFETKWWPRMDMAMRFNEFVTRTNSAQFLKTAEVIVNADGEASLDINVTQ